MKLVLVRNLGVIIVFFQSEEVAKASTYLEVVLEEQKVQNKTPSEPKQHLFKNLNMAERYPHILFSHKDFGIGICFLEVIAAAIAIEGGETKNIEQFLYQLNEYSETIVLQ